MVIVALPLLQSASTLIDTLWHYTTVQQYCGVTIRVSNRSEGHGDILAACRRRNVQDPERPSRLRREHDARGGLCQRHLPSTRVEGRGHAEPGPVLLSHS